ncbi:MAG: hypothetical protein AAF384_14645 [Pseudomonadota bacterium]
MSISFHDPRGETRVAPEPYTRKVEKAGEATIGLLANGFPDSIEFLDAVERALKDALPDAQFKRYEKNNASIPATDEVIDTIAQECDALLTAYGH